MNLDPLRREASAATARGSKSFFFATGFFPHDIREAAHAVYWFCRYTDDLVDEAPDAGTARRDLEAWAAAVGGAFSGARAPEHPALVLFLDAALRHGIPPEYPLELIEGMRMDLAGTRYRTFHELRRFCYRVASVVGLMMSHVIGFRPPALDYAVDLGIAMQLTNILRDVGEDLARGRVYLPLEEIERFGYSEDMLRHGRRNGAFFDLMRFQVERARRYYEQAMPGIELLDARGRFAVQVAAAVYREILSVIEQSGYDVFARRAVVPARRKWLLTARGMAWPAARHSLLRLAFWRS